MMVLPDASFVVFFSPQHCWGLLPRLEHTKCLLSEEVTAAHDLIYFSSRKLQWLKSLASSWLCETAPSWPGCCGQRAVWQELRGAGCELSQGSGCSLIPHQGAGALQSPSPVVCHSSVGTGPAIRCGLPSVEKHIWQRLGWYAARVAFSTPCIFSVTVFMILFSFSSEKVLDFFLHLIPVLFL